jgi:hypothetical protein
MEYRGDKDDDDDDEDNDDDEIDDDEIDDDICDFNETNHYSIRLPHLMIQRNNFIVLYFNQRNLC